MSDNPTQEAPDSRPFAERVFARFDALGTRINGFESRIEAKVDALDGRLTTLEEKVDARPRETRPAWEAMQVRPASIEKEVKAVGRGVVPLHEDNLRVRVDRQELRERTGQLESQSTR